MAKAFQREFHLVQEGECFDILGDSYVLANLEYHFRLNPKWDVGVMAVWGLSRENYAANDPNDPVFAEGSREIALGRELSRYFAVGPSVRYTWHEGKFTRLYSRLATGLMRHHLNFDYREYRETGEYPESSRDVIKTESVDRMKWRMAYQLTAIGGSVGAGSFRMFGELGYGCLGVVRLGIAVSLF